MEDILKRVYKITEVDDNNVWEELQKRDLVIVKLIVLERFSKKKLNFVPYENFICYIGFVNVELIKYRNWNFFAILPPVNDMLRKKFGLGGKFAMYIQERDPAERWHVSKQVFITIDEKEVYNFVRVRANAVS
jgi:hypothetical protein